MPPHLIFILAAPAYGKGIGVDYYRTNGNVAFIEELRTDGIRLPERQYTCRHLR